MESRNHYNAYNYNYMLFLRVQARKGSRVESSNYSDPCMHILMLVFFSEGTLENPECRGFSTLAAFITAVAGV